MGNAVIKDFTDGNKLFKLNPHFMITWGKEIDNFVVDGYVTNSNYLAKSLNELLPEADRTWFDDKFGNSIRKF